MLRRTVAVHGYATTEGAKRASRFDGEVLHELTLITNDEKPPFVMPAWIAGIQIRKDACRDIHVDLDSSPPCWNDGIEVLYWT
jgi:hypothetical protein